MKPAAPATAPLSEVFASIQGEGAYVGEPQTFVRFAGCPLRCKYCDSESTWHATPRWRWLQNGSARELLNPASLEDVLGAIAEVEAGSAPRTVSITGGEPLVHADFLATLAPILRNAGRRVHLETAGVHARELAKIVGQLDHVSADWKLQSTMETGHFEDAHREFLKICVDAGVDTCVKCVLTPGVSNAEFERACAGVASICKDWLFILQPATPMRSERAAITNERIEGLLDLARARLRRVRVIPQVHRQLGVL
ncbi:MAG: 7-carboxy-7-deazaguanine synthase QueE [Planctomycetes bacterium]|nr:7-carboxy-7-deazaguanine synthase QueE [Planctomycetota bacterium]